MFDCKLRVDCVWQQSRGCLAKVIGQVSVMVWRMEWDSITYTDLHPGCTLDLYGEGVWKKNAMVRVIAEPLNQSLGEKLPKQVVFCLWKYKIVQWLGKTVWQFLIKLPIPLLYDLVQLTQSYGDLFTKWIFLFVMIPYTSWMLWFFSSVAIGLRAWDVYEQYLWMLVWNLCSLRGELEGTVSFQLSSHSI